MWNATAAFSRFIIPEPCFWGQSYGSMFEALVAVPFYWIRIPFRYALPIASVLAGAFPIFFLAIKSYKKDKYDFANAFLLSYLIMGWRWDILTSIPRSFISGMPFAVYGSVKLADDKDNTGRGVYVASLLISIGAIMTNTAAIIGIIGFLAFFFDNWKRIKRLIAAMAGVISGGIIYILIKNFYKINADFSLHPDIPLVFSFDALKSNLHRIHAILSDFVFFDYGIVYLLLIFVWILYLLKKKRIRTIMMLLLDLLLSVILLSMWKTLDYHANSVLFSQTRMFLYFPYSMLLIVYIDSKKAESVNLKIRQKYYVAMLVISIAIVIGKGWTLDAQIKDDSSALNNPYGCSLHKVDEILINVDRTREYADNEDADVIVTWGDDRAFSYIFDAMEYGKYTVYNRVYDRRTWNYHYLEHAEPHRCVFVDFPDHEIRLDTVEIDDVSIVDYLYEKYGAVRSG